jgi:hypothetical protein
MEHGLAMLPGKFEGLLGAARQNLSYGKDHGAVRIADIPLRALDVIGAGRLLQLVPAI